MHDGTKYLPRAVSSGDAVLMVLAKLRLALLNRDLAFRFNVSEATVAQIMLNFVPVIAKPFSKFIVWPTRPSSVGSALFGASSQCHILYILWDRALMKVVKFE